MIDHTQTDEQRLSAIRQAVADRCPSFFGSTVKFVLDQIDARDARIKQLEANGKRLAALERMTHIVDIVELCEDGAGYYVYMGDGTPAGSGASLAEACDCVIDDFQKTDELIAHLGAAASTDKAER